MKNEEEVPRERSPLSEEYLAKIKVQICEGGLDDENRKKNFAIVVNELDWYLRARKFLEAGESDNFLDIIVSNLERYKELENIYGISLEGEAPKFSTVELEIFIQDVKNLPRTIFSSQSFME